MNLDIKRQELPRAFQKVWHLKLNDPSSQRALWLRFSLFSSGNGFKRVAETWVVFYQRNQTREVKKIALKQSYDLGAFSSPDGSDIRIGTSELLQNRTFGKIQSKGQSVEWDLHFVPGREGSFSVIPEILSRTGLIKQSAVTLCEDLLFSGTIKVNGETIPWKEAPGMQGYLEGPRNGHSWVWGHCNTFLNEQGKPSSFVFEGLSTRTQIGPLVSPRFSSFFFHFDGEDYYFNTLKDAIHIRSKCTLNEWEFRADRDDISFRGFVKAEHKDFAGLTYEDTNGSLLYCTSSKLSDMKILIYKNGKLQSTFNAPGTAAFEVVSRDKNPYVPLLI